MKAIPKISHTTSMSHDKNKYNKKLKTKKEWTDTSSQNRIFSPSLSSKSENKCWVEARNLQESNNTLKCFVNKYVNPKKKEKEQLNCRRASSEFPFSAVVAVVFVSI